MMALPVLRVRDRIAEALTEAALGSLAREPLAQFLSERRWFGAKGRTPAAVAVRDVVPLFDDGIDSAVARLEVDLGGAGKRLYQLPLVVKEGEPAGGAILARVAAGDRVGFVSDALDDPGFRERLGRAFTDGRVFEGRSTKWVIAPIAEARPPSLAAVTARVAGAEQSNTSIVYGDRAIFKLYRRLEPGINPDVEIPEFLTRRGFRDVPRLYGKIEFHESGGSSMIAGMLQEFVANRGDGWSHALGRFDAEVSDSGAPPARPFRDDAARLGEITRGLHAALAGDATNPDFAPRPATAEDVRRWRDRAAAEVASAGDLLAERLRAGALAGAAVPLAERYLEERARVTAVLDRALAAVGTRAGARIRHHGDYHLGQVLATAAGDFMVVDFEGEPARPLAERRECHSALRDVAGMLRSFGYAAGEGLRRANTSGKDLEARAARWERQARDAFLAAYIGRGAPAAFNPPSRPATEALITLFEIEKVFYELVYELNNRPDWVVIPLRAIDGLRDAG